jgi:hypothetical protein
MVLFISITLGLLTLTGVIAILNECLSEQKFIDKIIGIGFALSIISMASIFIAFMWGYWPQV